MISTRVSKRQTTLQTDTSYELLTTGTVFSVPTTERERRQTEPELEDVESLSNDTNQIPHRSEPVVPEYKETAIVEDPRSEEPETRIETETPIDEYNGYLILEAISAAGMSEAFIAKNQSTGEKVFIKRVRIQSADKVALEREARIYEKLLRLNAKHVADVKNFVRDDNYIGLFIELADGGDLEDFVQNVSEGQGLNAAEAKQIALAVTRAIGELHANDIVHRDIKPRNILKFGDTWKVADFGIAKNLSRLITKQTMQMRGTRGYAAPEQFEGAEAHPSADIYSLGKTLAFLITGQTDVDMVPYEGWRNLIRDCIGNSPDCRPSIEQVLAEVESFTG